MADKNAAKRQVHASHATVDLDAMREAVRSRLSGMSAPSGKTARMIQSHADALRRGEATVSPAARRAKGR